MPGISGFEHDIFISYAHLDNVTITEEETGWIELFKKHLELSLNRRHGLAGSIKIWWDEKRLDGSMAFDQVIQDGVKESAVMLCLSSPAYFKSKYCNKEKELFYSKAAEEPCGLEIENRFRIINIQLNRIPKEEWPPEYKGRTGFSFNDSVDKDDFGQPLDPKGAAFKKSLRQLTVATYDLLSSFETEVQEAEPEVQQEIDEKNTIFFSEVSDTLRSIKKRTIIDLEKEGFKVVTDIPPPLEATDHENAVRKGIESSALSVHLLDEFPGREIIDNQSQYYSKKQAEIGLEFAKSQLIWVPKDLDISEVDDQEANYKQFLEDLDGGKQDRENYEYIRGMKSSLSREIIDYMEVVQSKQTAEAASDSSSVLVDTHFNDQLYALELSKYFLENQVQPYVNPQENDPRKNLDLLGERMEQVSKLIFLYGKVSKEWVIERINATLQLIITKNLPIEDLFIVLFPDKKSPDSISFNQRFLKVDVLDNSDSSSIKANNLDYLVSRIKGASA